MTVDCQEAWRERVEPQEVLGMGEGTVGEVLVYVVGEHLRHSVRVVSLAGELGRALRDDLVDVGQAALSVRNAVLWLGMETVHEVLTAGLAVGVRFGYGGRGAAVDRVMDKMYPVVDWIARTWAER